MKRKVDSDLGFLFGVRDALDQLGVNDAQRRLRRTICHLTAQKGHIKEQTVEYLQCLPAPEPAIHGPPGRKSHWQGSPAAAHAQPPVSLKLPPGLG